MTHLQLLSDNTLKNINKVGHNFHIKMQKCQRSKHKIMAVIVPLN